MRKRGNAKIAVRIIASLLVVAVFVSMTIAQPPLPVTVSSTTGVIDENGVPLLGDGSSSSDLVQLINAGSDGTINPLDENGNPTGDDSLICDTRIGVGYGPPEWNQGKFSHGLGLEVDTVIYCRAWNDAMTTTATRYGDSIAITVTEAGDYGFGTWATDTEKTTPSPTASPSPSPTPTPTPTSSPTTPPSPAQTETPTSGEAEQTPSPAPSLSPSPSPTLTPAASPTPVSSPAPAPAEPTPSLQTPTPTATEAPAVTPMDVKVLIGSIAISIVIAWRKRKKPPSSQD